jgi:hypothetical protein
MIFATGKEPWRYLLRTFAGMGDTPSLGEGVMLLA